MPTTFTFLYSSSILLLILNNVSSVDPKKNTRPEHLFNLSITVSNTSKPVIRELIDPPH